MAAEPTPKIYAAIAAVMADVAKDGISKSKRNAAQGYNFRGIDDVYNALAPILSQHKVIILPRVLSRELVERTSAKGGVLFYVTVEVEFDIVSGEDGSRHTVLTYGEAMDSGDKATNKAMSAAFKYAAMQAFCIPTEGDNDADSTTHEVGPREAPKPTLADRSKQFEGALRKAGDKGALAAAWKRGEHLRAELDRTAPERLVELEQLSETLALAFEPVREAA